MVKKIDRPIDSQRKYKKMNYTLFEMGIWRENRLSEQKIRALELETFLTVNNTKLM